MQVDYLRKNLAPHGKHLHERLVDYAKMYLLMNIGSPEEYIHKDVFWIVRIDKSAFLDEVLTSLRFRLIPLK